MQFRISSILSLLMLFLSNSTYAYIPVWSFTAVAEYPPQVEVGVADNAIIHYVVTNRSLRPHTLKMRPITGITASGCDISLQPYQSCLLKLIINGKLLKGDHVGGPVLCDLNNFNQCYQPDAKTILRIKRSFVPTATFIVVPKILNFTVGGSYQIVLVKNTSNVDIQNLQVSIPRNSQVALDSTHTTCTKNLAARDTCQYAFTPGNNEENNTEIQISGSNTSNTINVEVNVSTAILTLSQSSLSLYVGASGLPVIVNNTSDTSITNLQIQNLPAEIGVDSSSTCVVGGVLAPKTSCVFVFTASAPLSPLNINISGDNSNAPVLTISTITAPALLSVTSPTTPQILDANGTTTLSFTVTNTGTTDALDVNLISPWSDVIFAPSSCNTIGAGLSCNFTIQTSFPHLAGQIAIQGSNAATVATPFIAFRYRGGLVFSISGSSPNAVTKIVAENDASVAQWFNSSFINTGASSFYNGTNVDPGNTYKIILAQGAGTYAASVCASYNGEPSNTWYLPATCELGVGGFRAPCSLGTENITSNLYSRGFNLNLIPNVFYWSSTENTYLSSEVSFALIQTFNNSGNSVQDTLVKSYLNSVRCVRELSY